MARQLHRYIALLPLLVGTSPAAGADRPNIILCMADDLGWGDTGYSGNKVVKTPHLDGMARAGITFERWYAGAPVCSPTRGNCLTGRHPLRLGIPTANAGHLRAAEITLAEIVRAQKYRTGHFGKWHLGTLTTSMRDSNRGKLGDERHFAPPWQHGFSTCFSTEAKVPTYDPMKKPLGKAPGYGWRPLADGEFEAYGTHYFDHNGHVVTDNLDGDDSRIIMDRAIPFIRSSVAAKEPFFAVIWFHAPHLPVVAGPRHAKLYADLPWQDQMYFGCITALDEQVGRLRAELAALGVEQDTMLWFSSDNGPENRTPGTTGGLRARKRSLREGGIRVPGLLTWPQKITNAKRITAPCHSGDYVATVLAALDLPAGPAMLDGINLLPILEEKRSDRGRNIYFEYGKQAAVVGDRFKLYRAQPDKDWELYDLTVDQTESKDLAASAPDKVQQLQSGFAAWQASR